MLAGWAAMLSQWGDMPQAGEYHDDGLYFISAQSLATGHGYRILSLPGAPFETKYPPAFPAWLSLAWLLGGDFPGNLPWATALCAVWLPVFAGLLWVWLGRAGIPDPARDCLTALAAANPYVVLFGLSMLTEVPFTALALGAWLLLGRNRPLAAGALAGLAYLVRSAGLALLPAGILWMLLRGDRQSALRFAGAMLPAIAGWMLWCRFHASGTTDFALLYYTDYLGFHLRNFTLADAPVFLWKNLDGLLYGLGSLLLPKMTGSLAEKVLAQTLAVAALAGVVRQWAAGNDAVRGYSCLSGFYAAQLLVWHFPPNERFVLPLLPLALAGWWQEFAGLARALWTQRRRQPAPAWILSGLGVTLGLYCLTAQALTLGTVLPEFMRRHREDRAALAPVFAEIRRLAPEAVLTDIDPLLYLATGRPALGLIVPTLPWYREDWAARRAAYARAPGYAREHGIGYVLLRPGDFARDMDPEEHRKLFASLRADPGWTPVFSAPAGTLYRVLPAPENPPHTPAPAAR